MAWMRLVFAVMSRSRVKPCSVSPRWLSPSPFDALCIPLASTPDGDVAAVRAGRGAVVAAKRRTERERARLIRYDPRYGGDRSGVFRDQAVPTTWRGIGDRSGRACAGVGIGLVSECLRGPSHGGPLRGDETRGRLTGNNNLPAVDRGWRVGVVTNIANTGLQGADSR